MASLLSTTIYARNVALSGFYVRRGGLWRSNLSPNIFSFLKFLMFPFSSKYKYSVIKVDLLRRAGGLVKRQNVYFFVALFYFLYLEKWVSKDEECHPKKY